MVDVLSSHSREPEESIGMSPLTNEADPNGDPVLTTEILRLQDGVDAFNFIVERFGRSLMTICRGYFPNEQEAEDTYQEILMKLWEEIGRFDPSRSFKTWMNVLARNFCRDKIRFGKKRAQVNLSWTEKVDALAGGTGINPIDSLEETDLDLETERMQALLRRFLRELEEGDEEDQQIAKVMEIRAFQGLTFDEIGQITEVHKNTAKRRFQRAKERLWDWMKTVNL